MSRIFIEIGVTEKEMVELAMLRKKGICKMTDDERSRAVTLNKAIVDKAIASYADRES